ncbi:MAG: NADH-ubiquinone oxidoreductase-F iron-sulfur binding region domain-containing protein [Chromatiaceae bacterium]
MSFSSHKTVTKMVGGLLAARGHEPELLLQHLIAIQQAYSYVPETAIDALSAAMGVTRSRIRASIDFYSFLHTRPRGVFDILFSDNITDRLQGSEGLRARLCNGLGVTLGEPRSDGRVTVGLTSCTGMCDQGPALLVNGLAVTALTPRRIDRIAELVEAGVPLEHWPPKFFVVQDNIHRVGDLLSNAEKMGAGLQRFLELGPAGAMAELEASVLRGRGGAGFTTALKWRICRDTASDERYVVCNADEGEPGTFKDRVLLNRYADLIFKGMTLCAGIVGARRGYLYLRGEYRYLVPHLEEVLARRRGQGILGQDIAGQAGFDFDIDIHLGAGAYVCGEESALIESLEGRRGVVRKRPPYPVVSGFLGRPTVVNNVETFLAAASIIEWGGHWFRGAGTQQSTGSKLLSISGDVARPGIYEYDFGTPVSQILADCGGSGAQAVQVSGAAGVTLAPAEFHRSLSFEDLPIAGSFMVLGRERDLMDMTRNFARFFAHESCGFCTPCRVGCRLLEALVEKVAAGKASAYDLEELRNLGNLMRQTSYCGLGTTAANHVRDILDKFPDTFHRRLSGPDYTPAFDLDGALSVARAISGRTDAGAHLEAV